MHEHEESACGCREYRALSRRRFIGNAGVGLAATALPAWLPEVRFKSTEDTTRDVIVSVVLAGGADGLTLVAPFGDAVYYAGRPNISVPRPDSSSSTRGRALDNYFMLPPGMFPLLDAYQAGDLLCVHAAGLTGTTSRSHFEAQRYVEVGKPDDTLTETGWLARHLATTGPTSGSAPLRGVSLSYGMLRTLQGAPKTLAIPSPQYFNAATPSEAALRRLFANAWGSVKNAGVDALNTATVLARLNFPGYQPANGATYADTGFSKALKSIATMIRGDIGLEAAHVVYGGWDTHAAQGSVDGVMQSVMLDFATGLAAFWQDIMKGPVKTRVTLVAVSEFGRNVRENGSKGTDHGRAGVMFVMGPNIKGGRVLTTWPGIEREQLELGQDLRVTTDVRDIMAEIVRDRLGNSNLPIIFPGYTPHFHGITK